MELWMSDEGGNYHHLVMDHEVYPPSTQLTNLKPGRYRVSLHTPFYRWTNLEFELRSDTTLTLLHSQNLSYVGRPDTSLFSVCDTLEFTSVVMGCFTSHSEKYMLAKDSAGSWSWWGVSDYTGVNVQAQPCGTDAGSNFSKAIQRTLDNLQQVSTKGGERRPFFLVNRTGFIQACNAVMSFDLGQENGSPAVKAFFESLQKEASTSE